MKRVVESGLHSFAKIAGHIIWMDFIHKTYTGDRYILEASVLQIELINILKGVFTSLLAGVVIFIIIFIHEVSAGSFQVILLKYILNK